MAEQVIEVEAETLEEAKAQLASHIPEGFRLLSSIIMQDGKPRAMQASADTVEAAFAKVQETLPENAQILEKKELSLPKQRIITVEAFNEKAAEWDATWQVRSNTARVKSVKLASSGTQGFLGFGKTRHRYEAEIFEKAVVEITYKTKAKVSAKLEAKIDLPTVSSEDRKSVQSVKQSTQASESIPALSHDVSTTSTPVVIEAFDLLQEVTCPELYRVNAFRLTELRIDSHARDVARRQAIVTQASKAGLPVPAGPGYALPLEPAPDLDILSEAMQRLADPERRLIDELFWFWPYQLGQSQSDGALTALTRRDIKAARDLWLYREQQQGEPASSIHNLAVLAHARALDWEYGALSKTLSDDDCKERDLCWQEAFKYWSLLLDNEAFWSRVTTRIRGLDDPRLTTGTARRLRASLPLTLLMISAQLAVRAAEGGNTAEAQRHLAIIHTSGFAQNIQDEALRQAVNPIRERIKALCKMAETQAVAEPDQAYEVARKLLDQARPLLAVLHILLPKGNATHDGMHDAVSERALACLILFGNKTDQWSAIPSMLDDILLLAAGEAVRVRIEENRTIVKNNLVFSICWYCQTNLPHPPSAVEVKMFGNVTRTPTRIGFQMATNIQWQNRTIQIPRCAECKSVHNRANRAWGMGCLGGFLIILLTFIAAGAVQNYIPDDTVSSLASGAVLLSVVVAIAAFFAIGLRGSRALGRQGIRQLTTNSQFPAIQMLQGQGWQIGERPAQ